MGEEVGGFILVGFTCEGVEEFGVEEVDLGAVGGFCVLADEVAVADGGAAVGVALYAEIGEEVDAGLGEFREGVGGAAAGGEDDWVPSPLYLWYQSIGKRRLSFGFGYTYHDHFSLSRCSSGACWC